MTTGQRELGRTLAEGRRDVVRTYRPYSECRFATGSRRCGAASSLHQIWSCRRSRMYWSGRLGGRGITCTCSTLVGCCSPSRAKTPTIRSMRNISTWCRGRLKSSIPRRLISSGPTGGCAVGHPTGGSRATRRVKGQANRDHPPAAQAWRNIGSARKHQTQFTGYLPYQYRL